MTLNLTAKGDNEKIILQYLENNVSDVLAEKINSGTKTLADCWKFITECARKEAKNGCACIRDDVVFGWAIHFFEEDSIKPEPPKKEYINQKMPNGDTVRVEAKKTEATKCQPGKAVDVWKKPVEEKSELEKAQITLFDLMGAGDEN